MSIRLRCQSEHERASDAACVDREGGDTRRHAVLLALRLGAEEKMMAEQCGDEYAAYSARTKRLVNGVW